MGRDRESCQPDCREPMFQFVLVRALFAFTYQRPALEVLFKLPKPYQRQAARASQIPET